MLYCDIGNTCVKVLKADKLEIIPTNEINLILIKKLLAKFSDDEITICSVVPLATELFKIACSEKAIKLRELTTKDFALKLDVETPERVGVDLLALANFASAQASEAIIVNFGTATTITYVANKIFKGTIILPGILMQKNSFNRSVAKIQSIDFVEHFGVIGRSTNEAVTIGILQGQSEAVRGLVKTISSTAQIFCSGGNARYLPNLPSNWLRVEQATLQGIKILIEGK